MKPSIYMQNIQMKGFKMPKPAQPTAARKPKPTRNRAPATEFELLRRMLLCNKSELSSRLGVTIQTLRKWEGLAEAGEPQSANTRRAIAELMRTTLRASNGADEYLIDRK